MTNTTNTTAVTPVTDTITSAYEHYKTDAASVYAGINSAGNASVNMVVHFLEAVLEAETSNSFDGFVATHVISKRGKEKQTREFTLDVATLTDYAMGKLTTDEVKLILPTLRQHTPAWQKAFDAYEAVKKWSAGDKDNFAAHVKRVKDELVTFESASSRVSTWRSIYFAALVIASPEYDETSMEVTSKGRKSEVTVIKHATKTTDDGTILRVDTRVSLTLEQCNAQLALLSGKAKAKRTPKTSTANAKPITVKADDALISTEMVRKGGEPRKGLAKNLSKVSHLMGELDGAPNAKEFKEIVTLILSLEASLDADRMAALAKARKENAA